MNQELPRTAVIRENVSDFIQNILDEADSWVMPDGEKAPSWEEMRTAIMDKVFRIERAFGDGTDELNTRQAFEELGREIGVNVIGADYMTEQMLFRREQTKRRKKPFGVLKQPIEEGEYWYRKGCLEEWRWMEVYWNSSTVLSCRTIGDQGSFPDLVENHVGEWLKIRRDTE